MSPEFQEAVESLHPMFERLMDSAPYAKGAISCNSLLPRASKGKGVIPAAKLAVAVISSIYSTLPRRTIRYPRSERSKRLFLDSFDSFG